MGVNTDVNIMSPRRLAEQPLHAALGAGLPSHELWHATEGPLVIHVGILRRHMGEYYRAGRAPGISF